MNYDTCKHVYTQLLNTSLRACQQASFEGRGVSPSPLLGVLLPPLPLNEYLPNFTKLCINLMLLVIVPLVLMSGIAIVLAFRTLKASRSTAVLSGDKFTTQLELDGIRLNKYFH